MHTKVFQVLEMLSQLCEELNVLTTIEDCESTAQFFGTKADYTLKGRWLCACLPADDAYRIAKDTISIVLPYELDDQWRLLCVRFDGRATILSNRQQQQKKNKLSEGGCILTIDDADAGIYKSVCEYDGRVAYGTLDQLLDYYGLEE